MSTAAPPVTKWNEQEEQNGTIQFFDALVLRYFELEAVGQEIWSDYSAALNRAPDLMPKAAVEEKKDEKRIDEMAEYMAITFQETFADPLGFKTIVYFLYVGINDEFYRKGGAASSVLQITNRQFSVEEFLKVVHANTPFEKLKNALPILENKIREKREVQRSLVKQNFEKFVGAKATVDSVFLEMQSQGLTSGDYGLAKCRDAVLIASNKVKDLYAPLLEDQQRESELRKKIAWVNRHRWLLEAPQKLQEQRQIGDYAGFTNNASDLVSQWKSYCEREPPMLEKLQSFWERRVLPQITEAHEAMRDRLCKSTFSSATDAQLIMHFYDSLSTLLSNSTTSNAMVIEERALDVYLRAQNERLVVEINKIFISAL